MTSEEATLQKEHIPLFADRDERILHPRSGVMRAWTVLMVVMVAISAIVIPFEVRSRSNGSTCTFEYAECLEGGFVLVPGRFSTGNHQHVVLPAPHDRQSVV